MSTAQFLIIIGIQLITASLIVTPQGGSLAHLLGTILSAVGMAKYFRELRNPPKP